ncbi:hypothetical protein ACFX2K_008364 [Malus domestica]
MFFDTFYFVDSLFITSPKSRASCFRVSLEYVEYLNPRPPVFGSSEMAGHKIAHATLKGPSVVKEILYGSVLALACGSLWKMHHWNEQRKVRAFYDLLEKGEISVVAEE